jgi:diacylglycerol kinase family enzyme
VRRSSRRTIRWLLAALVTTLVSAGMAFRRRRRRGGAAVARSRQLALDARPEGKGVSIVVNVSARAADVDVADELRRALPAATVVDLEDPSALQTVLGEQAAKPEVTALGVVGGDGSANAAVAIALEHELPLMVVPAGTLNHLARDLGVTCLEDATAAVEAGEAIEVDVATIDGRTFLNTASFGSYAELVDTREGLEDRIGKWPALVVALVSVLRRSRPVEVELDGVHRSLWMIFLGNCRYLPDGFAPTRRERLDDGKLDVRLVDAGHPWCRTRLILGLLTGRLGRSPVYDQWATTRLRVRADGPMRLACDGETFDGSADVQVVKDGSRVAVFAPAA